VVLDAVPSRGPLSGLAAALGLSRSENLIALAVDMPFMTLAHLQDLCALASAGPGVIPVIDEQAEPLSAIYPVEACALFQEALRSDDFSLQSIAKKLIGSGMVRVMPVSYGQRALYKSVNEAGDLA
jgi:molybdopterin-guanine dinucleotide biosynthesis protein A